jgi:hypothetical protein
LDSAIITEQQKVAANLALYEQNMLEIQACIEALVNYAAILSRHDGKEYLPDLRDIVSSMIWVWAPEDFITPGFRSTKLQEEYAKKITAAARSSKTAAFPSELSDKQLEAIVRGLSIHAEHIATARENLLEVWQCCRLAKKLRADFSGRTSQALTLRGNFTIDETERFLKFGSVDPDHMVQGVVKRYPVLVINTPIPLNDVPLGWYCRHLTGRNIQCADQIWRSLPESGYVGSVLSPVELIWGKRETQRIPGQFSIKSGFISLNDFCENNHFHIPDTGKLFPEWEAEQKQTLGGMTLG